MFMQIKKFVATLAAIGACTVGGLSAVSPAYATTNHAYSAAGITSQRTAIGTPEVAPSHWEFVDLYYTPKACNLEGAYLVKVTPNYSAYRCDNQEAGFYLYVLVTAQT